MVNKENSTKVTLQLVLTGINSKKSPIKFDTKKNKSIVKNIWPKTKNIIKVNKKCSIKYLKNYLNLKKETELFSTRTSCK
jgi:hypothetical protein